MKNVIYQIVNLVNGKRYIGSALCFKRRTQYEHLGSLRKNKHYNNHLQNAWNKYGESNFLIEIIGYVDDPNYLIDLEQFWIDQYDFKKELYNKRPKAESNLGYKQTKELRQKRSKAMLGENNHMYGRTLLEEQKTKALENSPTKKSVIQFDKSTGKFIAIYKSIRQAAKQTGIDVTSISRVCNKIVRTVGGKELKHKTAGGYGWKFRASRT